MVNKIVELHDFKCEQDTGQRLDNGYSRRLPSYWLMRTHCGKQTGKKILTIWLDTFRYMYMWDRLR